MQPSLKHSFLRSQELDPGTADLEDSNATAEPRAVNTASCSVRPGLLIRHRASSLSMTLGLHRPSEVEFPSGRLRKISVTPRAAAHRFQATRGVSSHQAQFEPGTRGCPTASDRAQVPASARSARRTGHLEPPAASELRRRCWDDAQVRSPLQVTAIAAGVEPDHPGDGRQPAKPGDARTSFNLSRVDSNC
jgi:hypothetical protein